MAALTGEVVDAIPADAIPVNTFAQNMPDSVMNANPMPDTALPAITVTASPLLNLWQLLLIGGIFWLLRSAHKDHRRESH